MTNIFTYATGLHDKMSLMISRLGESLTDKIEIVQQLREGVIELNSASLGKFSGTLENLFHSSSAESGTAAGIHGKEAVAGAMPCIYKTTGSVLDTVADKVGWAYSGVRDLIGTMVERQPAVDTKFHELTIGLQTGNRVITGMAVTDTFGGLHDIVGSVTTAPEIWTVARETLNGVLSLKSAGLIAAPITAIAALIGYVAYTTEGWGQTWDNTMKFMSLGLERFTTSLTLKWFEVKNEFHKGIDTLKRDWYGLQSILDMDGAQVGTARIKRERDERTAELKATADKIREISARMTAMTVGEVRGNGKGVTDITTDLKKKFGFQPAAIPKMRGENEGDAETGIFTPRSHAQTAADSDIFTSRSLTEVAAGTVNTISGAGRSPDPATININLDNLVHTMTINCGDIDEGAEKLRDIVLDELSRALKMAQANA